jgi:glucose 1-dehydrogenase
MSLSGKTAIVTGAGRGIGRAIAVALARAGANVGVNDISSDAAHDVAREIDALGSPALPLVADVASQEQVQRAVERVVQQFGRLDIAISNAAYSDRELFYQAQMEGFRRTVDVTMWGAFHLVHAAARQMLAQDLPPNGRERGNMVVIGSPHANVAVPTAMAYNMAKAAVDHMARTAAIELIDRRIRVNIIHPGWTDTPGERKFASDDELQRIAASMPWGRMARPEEIARGVLFLCDPGSEYITGSTLLIDGGLSLPWWENRGSQPPAE